MRSSKLNYQRISQTEWVADFEFRATGPEHGGGNLQIWYTDEGQAGIGSSSIYTVEKFEGLVLVIDMYGGRVSRRLPACYTCFPLIL